MRVKCPKPEDVRTAVDAYNREHGCGDADADLWRETAVSRGLILESESSQEVPREAIDFAEAVRVWGRVQGVSRDDYSRAASVLWRAPVRSGIYRLKERPIKSASLTDIVELEEATVKGM